ncbi:MAG: KUP/HAK/KT family potassium transporter [Deltaproteobacteria bacterium]
MTAHTPLEAPALSAGITAAPPKAHGQSLARLGLGALGVVYGDIGTSPLYALKECVHGPHAPPLTDANVLSLLSLIVWSITLVVSVKYLGFIMRADNQGEGGILSLLALLPKNKEASQRGNLAPLVALTLFGAALLYGEGFITPAISVLSAVEGLRVATDVFDPWLVTIAVVILIALFASQRRGTASIGGVFGVVMLVWFVTLAGLGLVAIVRHPQALAALDPRHALAFFGRDFKHAFLILGSVVLCITGSEALYADMGHFGRRPIQLAWAYVAFPALALNYLGQGATLLAAHGPERAELAANPFYALAPSGHSVYLLVALATVAAAIASQALISGAFSLTRQAVQLGFLPRVTITHTSSETEGQIYIPEVNWALGIGCVALVLAFRDSSRLAAAYGIAVTGTMAITSVGFYNVARKCWSWPVHTALPLVLLFLFVDLTFFASNALKFFDGGFLPIALAAGVFFMMRTWKRGRFLLGRYFARAASPLDAFLEQLHEQRCLAEEGKSIHVVRVPGVAVFLTSNRDGTPPLLLHHVRHVKSLHESVILVTVSTTPVPRVAEEQRIDVELLSEGFIRFRIHCGFMETPNVPRGLELAAQRNLLPVSLDDVTYFLGRETLLATRKGEMGAREELLFGFMSKNSLNATRYFCIPPERVVEIGMQIDL